mmetsp:Transcript_6515/g.12311  ORF Transcript_6515/g.12311 Transcript_6515/m.12311 type:complete len:256 (-) Transcript_6515:655-1422(-)
MSSKLVFCFVVVILDLSAHFQNVFDPLHGNQDHFGVRAVKKVTKRRNDALLYQVYDLFVVAARSSVADGPSSFLLHIELAVSEDLHKRRNDVGIDHLLDLVCVTCCDVGNCPARFFADPFLWAGQQGLQAKKSGTAENRVSLDVVSGNDVADSAKGRCFDIRGRVGEQLGETTRHARFNDSLDFLVRTRSRVIGQVRQSPASICQNVIVLEADQASQRRQCTTHKLKFRLRLAAAEVRQSPGRVSKDTNFCVGGA